MLHTYKAILRGNRLEWYDTPPAALTTEQPVAVHVTILDEPAPPKDVQPGHQMAAILEQLAAIHALADLTDPAAWERDIRQDRSLPDREPPC
jgi:hypothetical protein